MCTGQAGFVEGRDLIAAGTGIPTKAPTFFPFGKTTNLPERAKPIVDGAGLPWPPEVGGDVLICKCDTYGTKQAWGDKFVC